MRNNIFLLLIIFLFSCSSDQKQVQQSYKIFNTEVSDKYFIVNENQTIKSLFENLMEVCDKNETEYTGDYILRYDIIKKSLLFSNEDQSNILNIKIKGFLCPNSSKDIFYNELLVQFDVSLIDTILHQKVHEHIKKTIGMQSYPNLINIVVPDTVYIVELQETIGEILDGYMSFYKEITKSFADSVRNEYPLGIRITPELYYQKEKPLPPPNGAS